MGRFFRGDPPVSSASLEHRARAIVAPFEQAWPYEPHFLDTPGGALHYVDEGDRTAETILCVHGNPSWSFLFRRLILELSETHRVVAPDHLGCGLSDQPADWSYRLQGHVDNLERLVLDLDLERITLVVHDWGSALGFHWAHRHQIRMKAIVYMEAIVRPLTWEEWPESARSIFQAMRSPAGNEMILEKNLFVDRILPASVMRGLTAEEMDVYRRPYLEAGESRRPTLTWPREIPIDGQPADVVEVVTGYSRWLAVNDVPKLFINADPGVILVGAQREFCRAWLNQEEVTVPGTHVIQEDSPDEIGRAIAQWYSNL